MRANWRSFVTATLCGPVCLVVFCVAYDIACFQPAWRQARVTVLQHPVEDQFPPQQVTAFLHLISHGDTVPFATRLLLRQEEQGGKNGGGIRWTLKYAAWSSLVAFHLSEADRLSIIASFATTGAQRQGLVETALAMFGKQPSSLSSEEIAVLAVLIQAPSISTNPKSVQGAALHLRQRMNSPCKQRRIRRRDEVWGGRNRR